MENNKKKSDQKMGYPLFDELCACGSGDLAGACCKSVEPCPCASGEIAGECCYAPLEQEEE